jgi:hypothetical protein
VSFIPPSDVRSNAKRGLELRKKYGRGGTAVGVARARDLSNGASLPIDTIQRMNSYFARHEVDKQGEGWGKDSAGYIAWLLWGGDAGWRWAKGILAKENKKDKMTDLAFSYAGIIKSEKQADGTLKVYGKATDDSIDIDLQICDEDWLKRAMPDWFKSGGNIREQHSNIASGVATDYESKADGHYITALVVDPVSVKKVETGVLKGFSIGIRGPRLVRDEKAVNGRIIDGQIVEVSLVDRPANPNAKLMLAKALESGELVAVDQNSAPSPADVARMISKNVDADPAEPETEIAAPEIVEPEIVEPEIVDPEIDEPAETVDAEPEIETKGQAAETDPADDAEKSVAGEIVKGDIDLYNKAISALAELIKSETDEIVDGDNENKDIKALLKAMKHLQRWHKIEAGKGEVPILPSDKIDADDVDGDDDGCSCDCDSCKNGYGCGSDGCTCGSMKTASADHKDLAKTSVADDGVVASIIEKAVASAKEAVTAEIDTLASALKAEQEKSVQLQADLDVAKKAVAGGGPKRSAITKKDNTAKIDALLAQASVYANKSAVTTDPTLREGYRQMADDLRKKAERKAKA